jgi:hypothetical protein
MRAPIDAATRGAEGSNEGEAGIVIVEGTDASMRDATRMCCAEMIWPDVTWSEVTGVVDNMEMGCVRKATTCGMAGAADMWRGATSSWTRCR